MPKIESMSEYNHIVYSEKENGWSILKYIELIFYKQSN